jgi:hypothetical protein
MATLISTRGEIPLSFLQQLKKTQKEQKAAYKAGRLEYEARQKAFQEKQDIFNYKATIDDVFANLYNAHQCVSKVWKVDGILAFLDTLSIGRLALTCKTINSDIKESNVLSHPKHIVEISNQFQRINANRDARIASERAYEKQRYIRKIQGQLIHAGKFTPDKYKSERERIRRKWMERYNTKIIFTSMTKYDGSFYERIHR